MKFHSSDTIYDSNAYFVFRKPNQTKRFFKVESDGITLEEFEEFLEENP